MKKHLLILFPALALLLAGCGGNGEQPTTSGDVSTSSSPATSIAPPSTGPAPSDNHLIGISVSPSKDFVASIGQVQKFTVSYSGGQKDMPIAEEEKEVQWTTSSGSLATIQPIENSHNVNVTFTGAGKVTISVKSLYNEDYHDSVSVTVYQSDEYHYVWNCGGNDKDKFAAAEGNAILNGLSWHYLRHKPSAVPVKGGQALKFGQGNTDTEPNNNEGQIDFTLSNTKKVEKIIVGCCSTAKDTDTPSPSGHGYISEDHGSSKITMTVGSTVYYGPDYTQKGQDPEPVVGTSTTLAGGNIVISFSESVAAIYLQNIIIIYAHNLEEIVVSPTSPHKVLYEVGETFSADGLVVYAHYTNDSTNYDVTNDCTILAPSLSSAGEKDVNIMYSVGGISKITSYKIDVNEPRNVVSVEISGSLTPSTKYEVGDVVDYSALKVVVTWDAVDIHDSLTSELALPTANGGDFTEVTNIYANAVLAMNNDYTMSLKYKGQSSNNFDVAAGTFVVVDYNVVFDFAALDEAEVSAWTSYADRTLYDSNMYIAVEANLKARDSGNPIEQVNGLPATQGSSKIYITTITPNLAIESVSLEFEQWVTNRGTETESKKAQTVKLHSSILGTYPYSDELANTKDFLLNYNNFEKGTNSIMLSFGTAGNNIGLKKFTIKVKENTNAVLDSITYEGELETKQYADGEYFDPTGITVYANFTDPVTYPRVDITSAASFNGDAALTTGMTQVTCNYADKNVIVTGITVVDYIGKTYNKVTSAQDDYCGTYIVASASLGYIMNGALATGDDLKANGNILTDQGSHFDGNVLTGTSAIDAATFEIVKYPKDDSFYSLRSASGLYLGRGSSTSATASPQEKYWVNYKLSISFDSDHLVVQTTYTDSHDVSTTYYLGFVNHSSSHRCQYEVTGNFPPNEGAKYVFAEFYKLAA